MYSYTWALAEYVQIIGIWWKIKVVFGLENMQYLNLLVHIQYERYTVYICVYLTHTFLERAILNH